MSCKYCQDLCVKYIIREPRQLSRAIRIAHNALKEEIISEVTTTINWNQFTFTECAEQMIGGISLITISPVIIAEPRSCWELKPIMAVGVTGLPKVKNLQK